MSEFKRGDKVRVHIADALFVRDTRFHQDDPIDEEYCEVRIQGSIYGVPLANVEWVTPPCPWTEVGTIVQTEDSDIFRLLSNGWQQVAHCCFVEFATAIAPFNPVRLVPEVSS